MAEKAELDALRTKLDAAVAQLDGVVVKKMFGCDGFFAGDKIFALVWKDGRIGVRLPDPELEAGLRALPGSGPWKAGPMAMSFWVLVPPAMHDDARALAQWVARAYALTRKPDPPKPSRSKPPARKAGKPAKPARAKSTK